jgi:hypothetical protein
MSCQQVTGFQVQFIVIKGWHKIQDKYFHKIFTQLLGALYEMNKSSLSNYCYFCTANFAVVLRNKIL